MQIPSPVCGEGIFIFPSDCATTYNEKRRAASRGYARFNITVDQLKEIAEYKMPDLNANDVEGAMRIVAGTARNMGIKIEGFEM